MRFLRFLFPSRQTIRSSVFWIIIFQVFSLLIQFGVGYHRASERPYTYYVSCYKLFVDAFKMGELPIAIFKRCVDHPVRADLGLELWKKDGDRLRFIARRTIHNVEFENGGENLTERTISLNFFDPAEWEIHEKISPGEFKVLVNVHVKKPFFYFLYIDDPFSAESNFFTIYP